MKDAKVYVKRFYYPEINNFKDLETKAEQVFEYLKTQFKF